MEFTVIHNQSEWDAMIAARGKKMIYIASDQCDGKRLKSTEWADNYEGTNVDLLYLTDFETNSIFLLPILQSYEINSLPAILYYNDDALEWARGAMAPDFENRQTFDFERTVGDDIIAYDNQNDIFTILKGTSVNRMTMPSRYIITGDVYIGETGGKVHGIAPEYANNTIEDNKNAASSYYRIEFAGATGDDKTLNPGSFHYKWSTTDLMGKDVTKEGDVSWEAGDSIYNFIGQFETYDNNCYASVISGESAIGVELQGTGANELVLTNMNGCSLIDCSSYAILDLNRTVVAGDSYDPNHPNIINQSHKSWLGTDPGSLLNTYLTSKGLANLTGANSACYDMLGYNRGDKCVVNIRNAHQYGGVSNFVSDGAGGSANASDDVMKESTFNTEVRDYTGSDPDRIKMKNFYTDLMTGTGAQKDLHDSLIIRFGSINSMYKWYLAAHSVNPEAQRGIVNDVRNKGVYETHILGRVFTVDYYFTYQPAYPPEYIVLQYEQNTPIYDTISSKQSSRYKVSSGVLSGDVQIYSAAEPYDLSIINADAYMSAINNSLMDESLGIFGLEINANDSIGSFAQYNASHCWRSGNLGCFLGGYSKSDVGLYQRPAIVY